MTVLYRTDSTLSSLAVTGSIQPVTTREEFGTRLRALRENRGLSLQRLSLAVYEADGAQKLYDPAFLSKIERAGARPPTRLMVLLGEVLDPKIEELPEYHLAMMRRALDEREIGIDQALSNLRVIDKAVEIYDEAHFSSGAAIRDSAKTLEAALGDETHARQDQRETGARSGRAKKGQA